MNTNGFVVGSHDKYVIENDLFVTAEYVQDLLELVGASGHPKRPTYADPLEDALDDFCSRRRCDATVKKAIRQAVDEEAHAGPDWYRLYPPINCHGFLDCVRSTEAGTGAKGWADQYRPTPRELAAFNETRLDTALRDFYRHVDTATIHNVPQVPGPAHWPPRDAE